MSLKYLILPAVLLTLFLNSCALFSSREVTVSENTSVSNARNYFQNALINGGGLTFSTENFLNGNMLQQNYRKTPKETLRKLQEYYAISGDSQYLLIAADLCRGIGAQEVPDTAIQYHLAALYYCRKNIEALRKNANTTGKIDFQDFTPFTLILIYNEACSGIFDFLNRHQLIGKNAYVLRDIEGRRYEIDRTDYSLSVPKEMISGFSLCSSYDSKALRMINRRVGFGVPLVGNIADRQLYRSLKTPQGLTIPVSLVITMKEPKENHLKLSLNFSDTTLSEKFDFPNRMFSRQELPLSLDFTTPLACFLNNLPNKNLISVMVNPLREEKNTGLYMVDPYNPKKIPVVFIHGLMSGPGTWVQMTNSLKNNPEIRQKYQFWFFYYSSGAPIMVSAKRLSEALLSAQKEFCTTPEATANFEKMVLVGHSMGGLLTRLLLQRDPAYMIEKILGKSWEEFTAEANSPKWKEIQHQMLYPPLPFVHRAVFLAVPHRGSRMAKWSIARFGTWITKMPVSLVRRLKTFSELYEPYHDSAQMATRITDLMAGGISNLDPDSLFIRAVSDSKMKSDLVYHSIIGNKERENCPGGSDGVVPYSSSHLNDAASEIVVKSNHSVHRTPQAIRELMRILLLHLKEEKK